MKIQIFHFDILSELGRKQGRKQGYTVMADQPHIIDDGFSEPEQVRKIFVGNLPYEADEGT